MTRPSRSAAARTRRRNPRGGAVAVEFALVGLVYFIVVFFVIQGGIYFLRVTVLDFATEQAARALMINDNPGYAVAAPPSAAAFRQDIANSGYGLLNFNNIAVSVRVCAPVWTTAISGYSGGCFGGFKNMPLSTFDPTNNTYQYYAGVCTVNVTLYSANTGLQNLVVNSSSCTGTCNTNALNGSGNGNVANGAFSLASATIPSGGVTVIDAGGGTMITVTQYNGATYTCAAGQDFLVQVQYTDATLSGLVSSYFSKIRSTLAFELEPSPI
jgi:Flp pilus assembly protein TadG